MSEPMYLPKPPFALTAATWYVMYTMTVRTIGNAMRPVLGYWMKGMMPATLLNRISVKQVSSSGRKRRKSFEPMMSRPIVLRTKP